MKSNGGGVAALLKSKPRWLALAVALVGIAVCVAALVGFLATILTNNLPWHAGQSVREHYLTVGEFYGQGFMIGFFLCFFLTMVAVTIDRWVKSRARPLAKRERKLPEQKGVPVLES
jgi:uncharacterized membrane protein YbhN (UPF0104 family)